MKSRIAVLTASILFATVCLGEADVQDTPKSAETSPDSEFTADETPRLTELDENREAIESIQEQTRDLELKYREKFSYADLQPGEWRFEDGVKTCAGYLTRVEDQDFCAADVPADWKPFDYDGQTYYFQPLSRRFEDS